MRAAPVFVHVDESCLGNQFRDRESPGGAAGLIEAWRNGMWERRDFWISEPGTTNNRMALRSAIEALRSLKRPCKVRLISDSRYLVNGINEWIEGWKRRGWKRKGGPVENLDLWQTLDREMARHEIEARWIRGHAGHPRNEYVNDLAVRAATEQIDSEGLLPSGFERWLDEQRENGRYLDYAEAPPPDR